MTNKHANTTHKEEVAEAIGKRLKALRTAANRSLSDLSTGHNCLSESSVCAVEKGRKLPTLSVLIDMANALGVRPGELVDAAIADVESLAGGVSE